jgi:hypothetical protein
MTATTRRPRVKPRPPSQARVSRLAHRHDAAWWARQRLEEVNPWWVELADTPVRHGIVEAYRRDPGRASSDGDEYPCLSRFRDGVLVCLEGKHRTLAARLADRSLTARVATEPTR